MSNMAFVPERLLRNIVGIIGTLATIYLEAPKIAEH